MPRPPLSSRSDTGQHRISDAPGLSRSVFAMPISSESRAPRWLEVQVVVEPVGRVRKVLRGVRSAVWEIFFDWFTSTPTIKVRSQVLLRRRDTGAVVATYNYDNELDAREHEESLRQRLDEMALFDLVPRPRRPLCQHRGCEARRTVGARCICRSTKSCSADHLQDFLRATRLRRPS